MSNTKKISAKISKSDIPTASNLWDDTLQRYVLQRVVLDSPGATIAPKIYFEKLSGEVGVRGGNLHIAPSGKVGFNTYANSFYAAYWEAFTRLRSFSLSGKIEGEGIVHLFRSTEAGKTAKIGEYPVSGLFHVHFDMFDYLPSDKAAGRIFFDFEALSEVNIKEMAFCAFRKPEKAVTFSLGVCTYHKERYITNLVLGLEKYINEGGTALKKLIIVNNDEDASLPVVLSNVIERIDEFTTISQENIGGAGGFTRSLVYAQEIGVSTHHIFMDDDIFLDPNMLDRMRAFASYCPDPYVFGGQMLNMAHPEILYEGGAKINYWGFVEKVGDNIDCTKGSEISLFDEVLPVDYNAWWFACIPLDATRKAGLPLNIFIRGDDFEYGLRLGKLDTRTISLPGLFVWHEPFENKVTPWIEYYNWRNRLIVAAIYSDSVSKDIPPVDMIRDIIAGYLLEGKFGSVHAMARGVLDFLRGPKAILGAHSGDLNKQIQQTFASYMDWDGIAYDLELELEKAMAQPGDYPMFAIHSSPRLGDGARTRDNFLWLSSRLVEAIDRVIALYMDTANAKKLEWQNEAPTYCTFESWQGIYSWKK